MISDHAAAELLSATLTSLWVGGLMAIGLTMLTRWTPIGISARSRLWALGLTITLIAPLVRLTGTNAPVRSGNRGDLVQPVPSDGFQRRDESVENTTWGIEEDPLPSQTSSAPSRAYTPDGSVPLNASLGRILLAVWFGGAFLGLVWLNWQVFRLVRLKQDSNLPPASLRRIWEDVYPQRGRRTIRLLVSGRSRLPAACGYFRPAVLAPADLCLELNERETRHLLLHELAHLDRLDDWWLLLHRLTQTLLWWHPVVWYICRKLDAEREMACDEIVARDGNRQSYARTLVRVAEVANGTMALLAPGILRGELTRRVESLLGIGIPLTRSSRVRAGTIAVSAFGLALWLSPPVLRPGSVSSLAQAETVIHRTIAVQLDSLFRGYVDRGFSGSILLAMGDEVILAGGYGMADRERSIPATAETRYSVAGFTKMFTAAAILTLEAEGRLRVSDSLRTFFGPLPGTADEVTLHQLLTHTDGLTRQNAPVYRVDAEKFIHAVSAAPDSFVPGQGYRYNDFGHSVLGVIVEQVTGKPYESFIRDRFLRPAGLSSTGFEDERNQIFAAEYAGPAGAQYLIPPRAYTWGRRASLGMVSTVGDMYRWVKAIEDSTIFPPGARERMFQVHGPTDWGAERGYGWDRIRLRDGSRIWRRVAGTPGMEGEILHDPKRGWMAVILVNSRVEWRFRVWEDITRTIAASDIRHPR